MKSKMFKLSVVSFLVMFATTIVYSWNTPLIIDHTCTDLSQIPAEWIDSVQANLRLHYAHTSHGGQLTTGLSRIETADATYSVARQSSNLPTETSAFRIFDGQEHDTYITPAEYWGTTAGMNDTRDVLNNNPTINVSMWSWCCQLTGYSEAQVNAYLDSITTLETEFPDVIFIYMTCNSQATGGGGYNRYMRNQQIRQYCNANNKVLFDFGDLDSWWYNPDSLKWEFASYTHSDSTVPVEHSHFDGNEAGHTTYESCEQKGKAVWWMMAKLTGWADSVAVDEDAYIKPQRFTLYPASPTTFRASTKIGYELPKNSQVSLIVYDITGKRVKTLIDTELPAGCHSSIWDGTNDQNKSVSSGIYFLIMSGSNFSQTKKVNLVR